VCVCVCVSASQVCVCLLVCGLSGLGASMDDDGSLDSDSVTPAFQSKTRKGRRQFVKAQALSAAIF
jgi:hypothetical protein